MARCLGCMENPLSFVSMGVFSCPKCGRVDADGKPAPVPEAAIVSTAAGSSFAAPPPPRARAGPAPGLPSFLLSMVVIELAMSFAGFVTVAIPRGFVLRIAVYAGLLTRKRWAWVLAIGGAIASVGFELWLVAQYASVLLTPRALLPLLLIGIDVAFAYALFRDDTRKYFEHSTENNVPD